MAEFTEVMRQAKRMCKSCAECSGCAMRYQFERIVMTWAAEHPEPRYPTWNEWHRSMFPDATALIRPCEFESVTVQECYNRTCITCIDRQIPADIAAKLGIKPIKEGNHAN